MKAPQARKTPKHIDHDYDERVRVDGDTHGLTLAAKRDSRYRGFDVGGPEGVRQLRDLCQAWLDYHEQETEADQ